MLEKLKALFQKVKPMLLKLYNLSPFLMGIAVGYFLKPLIHTVVSLGLSLTKLLFRL